MKWVYPPFEITTGVVVRKDVLVVNLLIRCAC